MSIRNFTYGVIRAIDGLGNDVTFTFDGSFVLNIPGRAITFAKDRGKLPDTPCPIRGAEQEMTGSFTAMVEAITNNGSPVTPDLVFGELGSGYIGSNWQSTNGPADIYLGLDIEFTDGVNAFTLRDCKLIGNYTEAEEGNRVDFSFVCPHAYPDLT